MRNILLVLKHEIAVTIGKPVFWLTTFVLPAVIMVFSVGAQFISVKVFTEEPDILGPGNNSKPIQAVGYVDNAGIIHDIPSEIPKEYVRKFDDIPTAQQAMDEGTLSHYYIIDTHYLSTGNLVAVDKDFTPLGDLKTIDLFQYIITYNLTGDRELASLITNPIKKVETYQLDIENADQLEKDDEVTSYIIGFGTLFILFMVLTMSSGFMLRSVSQEKENQTVEVLLVSLRAHELILGKIAGLGMVALLQMAIWYGGSGLILQRNSPILHSLGIVLKEGLKLPSGFAVWAVIYLLLGYILYASVLGAIGALAPNARESGQFTFFALMPLMIPMWMNTLFVKVPNGHIATLLSIFPLTSPTSMLPRLASGGVPIWQPIVSVLALLITTYLFVLLAARFFRADTLLSSASLNWKRIRDEFKKSG